MSIILKGIDLTEMGEKRRITIFDNGDVVVKEERWDEDGYKHYRTLYDAEAIQIPYDVEDIVNDVVENHELYKKGGRII